MITHKLVLALLAVTGVGASPQPGQWQRLPAAPISPEFNARTSVWTGKQMLLFGRDQRTALDAHGQPYATGAVNVAAAYDPASGSWQKLDPPSKTSGYMDLDSVWTGKEMLVWGQGTHLAYNPSTNRWRELPDSRLLRVHDGFGAVVWTGKELLGWGGGCCGDSFSDGVAYTPASNAWRALPRAPLAGSQHPLGVWTGQEYIVVAGRRAAAYSPAKNAWQALAPPPLLSAEATALWSGHEVIVAGGSRNAFSYDRSKNRWHRLPSLPAGRGGKLVVWNGSSVLVWGGLRGGAQFIPGARTWSPFAHGPLPNRLDATAVWARGSLIVWGGVPTKTWGTYREVGATFTPPAGCGDGWMAQNLVVTRKVKADLRAAYASAHHGNAPRALAGRTYYGSYSGTAYAIATFGRAPTIFRTDAHGLWRVRQDTSGSICSNVVPIHLIQAWSLRRVARSCYALSA
jgi:hypothetical protein